MPSCHYCYMLPMFDMLIKATPVLFWFWGKIISPKYKNWLLRFRSAQYLFLEPILDSKKKKSCSSTLPKSLICFPISPHAQYQRTLWSQFLLLLSAPNSWSLISHLLPRLPLRMCQTANFLFLCFVSHPRPPMSLDYSKCWIGIIYCMSWMLLLLVYATLPLQTPAVPPVYCIAFRSIRPSGDKKKQKRTGAWR